MDGLAALTEAIRAELTDEQVHSVRELRVGADGTWRAVASDFCERFPESAFARGLAESQILGMLLCQVAAERLGEDPEIEPWN